MKKLLYLTKTGIENLGSFYHLPLKDERGQDNFAIVHEFPDEMTDDDIFAVAQNGEEPWARGYRSMMVGDMILDTNTGKLTRCEMDGWKDWNPKEDKK